MWNVSKYGVFSGPYLNNFHAVYPLLHEHIYSQLRKNVSYASPTSQNELTEIVEKHAIHKRFIKEIKDAQYHSVSVDETTSSSDEIL